MIFKSLKKNNYTITAFIVPVSFKSINFRERQDLLLGLAKTVANNTAALVLKAKNVASKCEDQYTQNRVWRRDLIIAFAVAMIFGKYLTNIIWK